MEERLKEVDSWYESKKIDNPPLVIALHYVIEHIGSELKAAQSTIDELRQKGEYQLADTLQKLNKMFEQSDFDGVKIVRDEALEELRKAKSKILNNELVIYRDVPAKYDAVLQYKEAGENLEQAVAFQRNAGIIENTDYASDLNNLTLLYYHQGKYEQAKPLLKEALGIKKKVLGTNHPDYAKSLNNLALLYKTQDKYDKAELLYKEALGIDKKALGTNHPSYAASLNNLAALYETQGKR